MDRVYQVMAWAFAFVFGMVVLLSFYGEARAATFTIVKYNNDASHYIALDGAIEEGDLERLKSAYRDSRIEYNFEIIMTSPGGNGHEMKKIVEWIRSHSGTVYTRAEGDCYSACAVIWASGDRRAANSGSTIGFHISSIGDGQYIEDYARDWGVFNVQAMIQQAALEDVMYIANLHGVDPTWRFFVVQQIANHGATSRDFWVLEDLDIINVFNAKVLN